MMTGAPSSVQKISTRYEAREIVKNFGGTQALKGVSLTIRSGEVHAIVGENGAGKSTLVKILSGVYPSGQYGGELVLNEQPLSIESIHSAESHGIFLVPQDLQIVPELTIAENLFLNREPQIYGLIDAATMFSETATSLEEFQLDVDPDSRMGDIMPAQQQLVVIARAMLRKVSVLLLDEPTAALTDTEAQVLFRHIGVLRQRGIAIIYISHRLDEITQIADVVTVLRDGRVADHLSRNDFHDNAQRIVRAMIGRDVAFTVRHEAVLGEERLTVSGLTVGPHRDRIRVTDISFSVRAGEVVGLFGSVGCGSDHVVRALLGTTTSSSIGSIGIDAKAVSIRQPRDALKAGIGYLPGDRQRDAMFSQLTVAENIGVLTLDRATRAGVISPKIEVPMLQSMFDKFRVKAASLDARISTLSGGNQQKAMLARVLSLDPGILILHEPAQGVDIGTKQELYTLIDQLALSGKAILVVSSDLDEVLTTSDQVIVMRNGSVAGSWDRKSMNKHEILAAATGGK